MKLFAIKIYSLIDNHKGASVKFLICLFAFKDFIKVSK